MELLRGLMDTDGYCPKEGGSCEIASSYPALAVGIVELIRTLGFKPVVKRKYPKGGMPSDRITFIAYSDWPVFHLQRKKQHLKPSSVGRPTETSRRRIVAVDLVDTRAVRCIAVASKKHLFLAGEAMIPTHNTEASLNWIGYVMHHAPAPMLVVVPTLEVRKRWVKQRLDPLLNETPAIRALFDGRRQRDSANSEDMKDFPGGLLVLGGANSPASLSSMPIRYVVCDEVDRFPWEVGQEGDPLGLIDERTKTFPRRKVLLVSTPTVKGASRIEAEYDKTDQRQYHVPCPHCGDYQVLRWRHDNGNYGLTHLGASGRVVYTCQACGCHIAEHDKTAMLAAGKWLPRHPERPHRGYQLSGLYSPIGLGFTWAELWKKWTDAHGDTANLKRFVNTTLAETWTVAGDSIEDISLISRLEDYPAVLPLLARTAFVDVQKDRLEMSIIDWGAQEESWLFDHIILPGDTAQQDVWDALSDELDGLHIDALGIDSGYNATQVYAFVANKRWAYATKGIPGMQRPIAEDERTRRQRLRKKNRRSVVVEPIGVDNAKALIYARLKQDKPGKGTIHFPRQSAFDDEYFSQVASEKLVTRVHGTRPHQESMLRT